MDIHWSCDHIMAEVVQKGSQCMIWVYADLNIREFVRNFFGFCDIFFQISRFFFNFQML